MIDTKQLRHKLLDLAIRGKLVPQDPNDEPASVLIDQIKVEKDRLISEGKIKRGKKESNGIIAHHSIPFEVPNSWEWAEIGSFTYDLQYGTSEKSAKEGSVPVLRMGNITRVGTVDYSDLVYSSNKSDIQKYALQKDDLLFNRTNSSEWVGKTAIFKSNGSAIYAGYLIRVRCIMMNPDYLNYVMNSSYHRAWCNKVKSDAVNQSNINAQKLSKHLIPIPPIKEQERIVNTITYYLSFIEDIENQKERLSLTLQKMKRRILDLALQGNLVEQNSNDEPAVNLLRRINPNIKNNQLSLNSKLPSGWCSCKLEDIVDYEQPTQYIVESTNYSNEYKTPVLTAGKTFILGYTNETEGIYKRLPTIIFDDFTTDSKLVEFPFKVKSSAMKILQINKNINIKYVAFFMSITRLVGDTHKRYWISEYSKIEIPIPPINEQNRIVAKIDEYNSLIDEIENLLN